MNEFEQIEDSIRERLIDFVESSHMHAGQIERTANGIKFRCPNSSFHKHGDRKPSAIISSRQKETFHCFVCGCSGNIFQLNNYWNNAPLEGKDFLLNNVNPLAQQFGIRPVSVQLNEEDIERNEMYRCMNVIKEIMSNPELNETKYAESKGVTRETCLAACVGTIKWDDVANVMKARCPDEFSNRELMSSLGIHKGMFGPKLITVLIFDDKNRPVGLSSRDMTYDSAFESMGISRKTEAEIEDLKMRSINFSKWKNSRSTIIYHKKELLYGFNFTKRASVNKIYIFEGYWDFLIPFQTGLDNCAAVCGVALTDEHIEMLVANGFTRIILAFDNDVPGQSRAEDIVRNHVKPGVGYSISILKIPETINSRGEAEGDPDVFIMANGLSAFENIQPEDAFDFKLRMELKEGGDKLMMAKRMLPIVCSFPDAIYQDKMINSLATICDINIQALREDRAKIMQSKSEEVKKKAIKLVSDGYRDFMKKSEIDIDAAKGVVDTMITDLNNIVMTDRLDQLNSSRSLDSFSNWSEENSKMREQDGWRTGFQAFDDAIDLIPKKNAWICIPGAPNQGKSAFLYNLITGLCAINFDSNLSVLLMSLDDSEEVCYMKIVSLLADVDINEVKKEFLISDEEMKSRISSARETLGKWIKNKTLVVKDAKIGSTPQAMKMWIETFQREEPTRSIVFFLDNFHCFDCSDRTDWIRASKTIHKMKTTHKMTFFSTMEVPKGNMDFSNPEFFLTQDSIAESGKMVFDANLIITVNCEFAVKPDPANVKYKWIDSNGTPRPLVRLVFAKNKLSSFKSSIWFKFNPSKGRYRPVKDIRAHMQQLEAHGQYYGGNRNVSQGGNDGQAF